MNWSTYIYVFFLANIKFLFASSIAKASTDLSFIEIFLSTLIGAIFCFNLFFFLSKRIMNISHKRRIEAYKKGNKRKKNFTKKNKLIVRLKNSKMGFLLICILAPLFLSIPIGTIVVAKFYGERINTYIIVSITLIIVSLLLSLLSDILFQ